MYTALLIHPYYLLCTLTCMFAFGLFCISTSCLVQQNKFFLTVSYRNDKERNASSQDGLSSILCEATIMVRDCRGLDKLRAHPVSGTAIPRMAHLCWCQRTSCYSDVSKSVRRRGLTGVAVKRRCPFRFQQLWDSLQITSGASTEKQNFTWEQGGKWNINLKLQNQWNLQL